MTKFICIGGKAQNGKTSTAELLKNKLEESGKRVLVINYADLLKFICSRYFGWNGVKDEAGRTLLQNVGTNIIRERQPNYWVDFVTGIVGLFPDEWDYVIVGDTRFPNEIYRIVEAGYKCLYVRVVRPEYDNGLTNDQNKHLSETALDDVTPGFIITNDGTLNDLAVKVNSLVEFIASIE